MDASQPNDLRKVCSSYLDRTPLPSPTPSRKLDSGRTETSRTGAARSLSRSGWRSGQPSRSQCLLCVLSAAVVLLLCLAFGALAPANSRSDSYFDSSPFDLTMTHARSVIANITTIDHIRLTARWYIITDTEHIYHAVDAWEANVTQAQRLQANLEAEMVQWVLPAFREIGTMEQPSGRVCTLLAVLATSLDRIDQELDHYIASLKASILSEQPVEQLLLELSSRVEKEIGDTLAILVDGDMFKIVKGLFDWSASQDHQQLLTALQTAKQGIAEILITMRMPSPLSSHLRRYKKLQEGVRRWQRQAKLGGAQDSWARCELSGLANLKRDVSECIAPLLRDAAQLSRLLGAV